LARRTSCSEAQPQFEAAASYNGCECPPSIPTFKQNRTRLIDELKDLIRIPSISALPEHKGDVERAARRGEFA
jgi:hypothetical protein